MVDNYMWREKMDNRYARCHTRLYVELNCGTNVCYHKLGGPFRNIINLRLRAQLNNILLGSLDTDLMIG